MKDLIEIISTDKTTLRKQLKRISSVASANFYYIHKASNLPCLVAHIDTVYDIGSPSPRRDIPISKVHIKHNRYLSSPQGIGGDDRCGVYILLDAYKRDLPCNFLFTDLEEFGGIGAHEYTEAGIDDSSCYIELDRRGVLEAAYYFPLPASFSSIFSSLGFALTPGSYTDIAVICPHLHRPGINLSVGFYNEHRKGKEYVDMMALMETTRRLPQILQILNSRKSFEQ